MSDYLFLFIGGHDQMDDWSPTQMQAHMAKWTSWMGAMNDKGIFKGGNPLESSARTIAGLDKVVTDGPFAEAKEVVGGYIMIQANSLDEAAEVAKDCPIFQNGGRVEVRPIRQM